MEPVFNRVCIIVPLLGSIVMGSFPKQTKIALEIKMDFIVQWMRDVETVTVAWIDASKYDIIISTSLCAQKMSILCSFFHVVLCVLTQSSLREASDFQISLDCRGLIFPIAILPQLVSLCMCVCVCLCCVKHLVTFGLLLLVWKKIKADSSRND